ncbi:unnamed protein product, partial [Mesorhabditis belari]|uniref:ZP domain-containing protein n=1 Tax=Mesorhabditis belari TaxID=2138241 RepID=A0AAF3J9V6_9BILA
MGYCHLCNLYLFIYFLVLINSQQVDLHPELECLPTGLQVRFNTTAPFNGRIFVKGFAASSPCVSPNSALSVGFDACGLARTRVLNPRGLRVETTLILAHHPIFITKTDRAYRLDCFYTEQQMNVRYDLEIDDLTTISIHRESKMPTCQYEILSSPKGQLMKRVEIGQFVYHRWKCTDYDAKFCILVHSCFMESDDGQRAMIVDSHGCSVDTGILQHLSYLDDMEVGQTVQVCSFADRTQVYFQCQISVTPKAGSGCERPACNGDFRKIILETTSPSSSPSTEITEVEMETTTTQTTTTQKTIRPTVPPRQTVYLQVKPRQTMITTSTTNIPTTFEDLVEMSQGGYDFSNSVDGSGYNDFPIPPADIENKGDTVDNVGAEDFTVRPELFSSPEWGNGKRKRRTREIKEREAVLDVRTGIEVAPLDTHPKDSHPSADDPLCLSSTMSTLFILLFISLIFFNSLTLMALFRKHAYK